MRNLVCGAMLLVGIAMLGGCSGGDATEKPLITGGLFGSSKPAAPDPMAGLKQAASTSAKASRCGFYFDPVKLKAGALAAEAQKNPAPEARQKAEHVYDLTRASVTKLLDEAGSCSQAELAQVREDLPRYLAGDFGPRVDKQVQWSLTDVGTNAGTQPMDRSKVFSPVGSK